MQHDGSAIAVLDKHSDEGDADENIVGVVVLQEEETCGCEC